MERITRITPAYDKRGQNPDYGHGGCQLLMVLKGTRGAVQFVASTGWYLPSSLRDYPNSPLTGLMGTNVGYHSPTPCYDDQKPISDACEWLDGKPCYYDGSTLHADRVLKDILIPEGSDAVWAHLEEYYIETFGELA